MKKKIILMLVVVLLVLSLSGCSGETYTSPIDSGVGWGWFQAWVTVVADFFYWVSNLFGGHYWIGIVIITILVRTVGWPIYASTNNLTLKMKIAEPELNKIKEKYVGKNDEASQRKMQQETMSIYRKYGINFMGCFLPFLQMPIFISVYQVVRRMPLSPQYDLQYSFLWINNLGEKDPSFILPILVGVVMFISQKYSQKKPEYMENKKYDNSANPAAQTQKSMKYMMYFMIIMMVSIAAGMAGIALYWIIGTSIQIFQTYISRQKSEKKMKELRKIV